MSERLTPHQFHDAEGLQDWRVLGEGAVVFYQTGSFVESSRLAQAIAELEGVEDHPPAVDIRRGGVTVRLISTSADYMGMTQQDVDIARRISAAAQGLGLTADPTGVQYLLVIPGATNTAEVMPFWKTILGYESRADSPDEDLVDPSDRGPAFWLEGMEQPRADGLGAIHVAVWVPHEQAESRVAAALAAGGRMVRDDFAPSWWTLADPAGNEADVATTMGRE